MKKYEAVFLKRQNLIFSTVAWSILFQTKYFYNITNFALPLRAETDGRESLHTKNGIVNKVENFYNFAEINKEKIYW